MNDEAPASQDDACCPPPRAAAPLSLSEEEQDQHLARLCKALAHPARVAIVRLLLRRRTCVCGEIVDQLPLAQSTVSQHLAQLARAGIIRGDIQGPRTCYCVEPAAVAELQALLAELSLPAGRQAQARVTRHRRPTRAARGT